MKREPIPILTILGRNDMDSMNPGKFGAQCSHASNAFVFDLGSKVIEKSYNGGDLTDVEVQYVQWQGATSQGFGTVVTRAVTERQMRDTVEAAQESGLVAGLVHDPEYPVQDGATTHLIPVDTCAYLFSMSNDPRALALISRFERYP